MAAQPDAPQQDLAVAAIERVLKTERDGIEALRQNMERAERQLSEARAMAAALGRRADVRISKLHTAYLQKVDRDILALTQAQTGTADEPYDNAALEAAVTRLAARLTGAP